MISAKVWSLAAGISLIAHLLLLGSHALVLPGKQKLSPSQELLLNFAAESNSSNTLNDDINMSPQTKLVEAVATSAEELLADPKIGKIFSYYFNQVRQQLLDQIHDNAYSLMASSAIRFVLTRDGFVTQIEIITTNHGRDPKRLESLFYAAEPFPRIPPEIPHNEISFRIDLKV